MRIYPAKARTLRLIFAYLFLMAALASCARTPANEPASSLPSGNGKLILDLSGLRNDKGDVFVSLFAGRKGFPDDVDAAVVNRHQLISGRQCRIEIEDLPYGNYAVSVLHDENLNGKMEASMLGIPKEGFGFSGNPKSKLGPPDYDDVRFLLLVPEKHLPIVMQYETFGREKQRIMQERKQAATEN
jgi:uncharacterized protein (DUF2141 family)